MAFRDFAFPQVQQDLGLTVDEADLYAAAPPATLRPDFVATLTEGARLALAINTEKAKSEFIIAPVLLELRRLLGGTFGLFSGIELDVDVSRGLNGFCDFILTREARQFVLSTPLVAIVEAKETTSGTAWANVSRPWSPPSCSTSGGPPRSARSTES